ncbi:hypothetical protein [Lactobacillus selangorensis]|uniref:hypothetical protein n=1 Tax=Lactobacillus selangorensis TaxID=81857 RepID=UPI00070ECCE1|nr:hypothetical protein [Lactobacillus selangorensis]
MLFVNRTQDFHVMGICYDHAGHQIAEKRVCHNMSKREAKKDMQQHLLKTYSNSINLDSPIKVKVKPVDSANV